MDLASEYHQPDQGAPASSLWLSGQGVLQAPADVHPPGHPLTRRMNHLFLIGLAT